MSENPNRRRINNRLTPQDSRISQDSYTSKPRELRPRPTELPELPPMIMTMPPYSTMGECISICSNGICEMNFDWDAWAAAGQAMTGCSPGMGGADFWGSTDPDCEPFNIITCEYPLGNPYLFSMGCDIYEGDCCIDRGNCTSSWYMCGAYCDWTCGYFSCTGTCLPPYSNHTPSCNNWCDVCDAKYDFCGYNSYDVPGSDNNGYHVVYDGSYGSPYYFRGASNYNPNADPINACIIFREPQYNNTNFFQDCVDWTVTYANQCEYNHTTPWQDYDCDNVMATLDGFNDAYESWDGSISMPSFDDILSTIIAYSQGQYGCTNLFSCQNFIESALYCNLMKVGLYDPAIEGIVLSEPINEIEIDWSIHMQDMCENGDLTLPIGDGFTSYWATSDECGIWGFDECCIMYSGSNELGTPQTGVLRKIGLGSVKSDGVIIETGVSGFGLNVKVRIPRLIGIAGISFDDPIFGGMIHAKSYFGSSCKDYINPGLTETQGYNIEEHAHPYVVSCGLDEYPFNAESSDFIIDYRIGPVCDEGYEGQGSFLGIEYQKIYADFERTCSIPAAYDTNANICCDADVLADMNSSGDYPEYFETCEDYFAFRWSTVIGNPADGILAGEYFCMEESYDLGGMLPTHSLYPCEYPYKNVGEGCYSAPSLDGEYGKDTCFGFSLDAIYQNEFDFLWWELDLSLLIGSTPYHNIWAWLMHMLLQNYIGSIFGSGILKFPGTSDVIPTATHWVEKITQILGLKQLLQVYGDTLSETCPNIPSTGSGGSFVDENLDECSPTQNYENGNWNCNPLCGSDSGGFAPAGCGQWCICGPNGPYCNQSGPYTTNAC